MAIKDLTEVRNPGIDKTELAKWGEALFMRMGWVYDASATAEGSQQLALERGISPRDNVATTCLYQMRYGDDESGD